MKSNPVYVMISCGKDGVKWLTALVAASSCLSLYIGITSAEASPLWQDAGSSSTQNMGDSIAVIEDVNSSGDGKNDVVVGSPNPGGGGGSFIEVRSGATGGVITNMSGRDPDDDFGEHITNVGDVTGDGKDDFAVNVKIPDDAKRYYRIYSGANLSQYRQVLYGTYSSQVDQGCWAVKGAGDVDSDNKDDIACLDYFTASANNNSGVGKVTFLSGDDGSTLGSISNSDANISGFVDLTDIGDVNQDGDPDHAVVYQAYTSSIITKYFGVRFFSGTSGTILYRDVAFPPGNKYAPTILKVGALGDVDGDSIPDFFVASAQVNVSPFRGVLEIYSGETRSSIGQATMIMKNGGILDCVATDDVNSDGVRDVLCSARLENSVTKLWVFSGASAQSLGTFSSTVPGSMKVVGSLGDVTADGKPDFVLGAPDDTVGPNTRGVICAYGYNQFTVPDPNPSGSSSDCVFHTIGDAHVCF